eukprot:1624523-Rhodomonas_salina.1
MYWVLPCPFDWNVHELADILMKAPQNNDGTRPRTRPAPVGDQGQEDSQNSKFKRSPNLNV